MEKLLQSLPQAAFRKNDATKFQPKLTENERCAVLALERSGVSRLVLADAFGVDRRTVGHIVNEHSSHYKNIRRHYKTMDHKEFFNTYVTPEIVEMVRKAADAQPAVPDSTPRPADAPNPRARGMAGMHTLQPEQCAYPHNIEIAWRDQEEPDGPWGWMYRDLSSSTPDEWLHNGPESTRTSQACRIAMEENLIDD